MQQSSATPKNRDVGIGLRKIVACSQPSSQCLLVSTVFGMVSSLHPTSMIAERLSARQLIPRRISESLSLCMYRYYTYVRKRMTSRLGITKQNKQTNKKPKKNKQYKTKDTIKITIKENTKYMKVQGRGMAPSAIARSVVLKSIRRGR